MTKHRELPAQIVDRLAAICLGLPEAYQEPAWAGTRWMVNKKNFAHVVMIDAGWPPVYAQAAGTPGPNCVLTFRLPIRMLGAPRLARVPFFKPPWFANIVGMVIDVGFDADEVAELIAESYCVLAPKKLATLVERPGR